MLAADAPLDARPTPYTAGAIDAAPFDSVPGCRLRHQPHGRGDRPADRRRSDRHWRALCRSIQQETNAFRAINAAWKAERARSAVAATATSSAACRERAMAELVTSLAITGERVGRAGRSDPQAADRAVRAAEQHGCRLDEVGARALRLRVHQPDTRRHQPATLHGSHRRPGRRRRARAACLPGGGSGGQAAAAPAADDEARIKALDAFVRAGGTLVALNRARDRRDRSAEAAGEERARRRQPPAVLRGRIGDAGHDRSVAAGDGGHAEGRRHLRVRQSGVRDRPPDSTARCSRRTRPKDRRCDPATCSARSICRARPRRSTCGSATATSSCSASVRSGAASPSDRSACCSIRCCADARAGSGGLSRRKRRGMALGPGCDRLGLCRLVTAHQVE